MEERGMLGIAERRGVVRGMIVDDDGPWCFGLMAKKSRNSCQRPDVSCFFTVSATKPEIVVQQ